MSSHRAVASGGKIEVVADDAGRFDSAIVGRLVSLEAPAAPRVEFPGNPGPASVRARSIVSLRTEHIGRDVVIIFEEGDPARPLVIGVVQEPLDELVAWREDRKEPIETVVDGERIVLAARREVVLRCGKASLTLRQDGKVLLKGAHVVSRSSGPNKIRGGSVSIN
jgi:hypothetical protein